MENLRQLKNNVELVGTIKEIALEVKTSKKGKEYVGGHVEVEVKQEDKIHNHRAKVLVMATSKLFKSIMTVMNEYKSIDKHGRDNADRIRIQGEMGLNEYYTSEGQFRSFNEIKGVFFNRIEPDADLTDRALLSVEAIYEGMTDLLDAEQEPTGKKSVKLSSVAYGNNVVEFKKVVIDDSMAEAFDNVYGGFDGVLMALFTLRINNSIDLTQTPVEDAGSTHAFGSSEVAESSAIKKYTSNLELIGGNSPIEEPACYTEEEVAEMKKVLARKRAELKSAAEASDTPATGFGNDKKTETKTETKTEAKTETKVPASDDVPDFNF